MTCLGGSTEAQIISTAIAKLKPISELPGDKALNFVKLSIVSQGKPNHVLPIFLFESTTKIHHKSINNMFNNFVYTYPQLY
jgi:hypothetical protein